MKIKYHLISTRRSNLVNNQKKKKKKRKKREFVELKESKKRAKFLEIALELKKTVEHESDGGTN